MSFRMDNWLANTGVRNTYMPQSTGCCGGNNTAELIGGLLGTGMSIGMMVLDAKAQNNQAANATKASNSAASEAAQKTVSSYTGDIAAATNKFNTKYGKFGASISTEGVPKKSFAQMKSDLESKGKMLKDSVDADKQDNVRKYGVQQAVVTSLEIAESNFNNIASSLESIETSCQGKITVSGDTATAIVPDASEFEQYLTQEQKDSGVKGDSTQAYKDEKAMRESKANEYNRLQRQQKDICSQNGIEYNNGKPDFATKISDAKEELKKLGDAKVNGSMSVATYVSALEAVNAQLLELGTEAEFNAIVDNVKNIDTAYKNAINVQTQEKRVSEFDTAAKSDKASLKKAKRGGHKGLRGWVYDITHKDKNDANVVAAKKNYNISKGKADDQRIVLQKIYEQNYSNS